MIISFILLLIVTISGTAVSYLIGSGKTLLWRMAAGCIIGSAIYGTLLMLIGSLVGLNPYTSAFAVLLTLVPAFLFRNASVRKAFRTDWQNAKGKLYGGNAKRYQSLAYYTFFFVLFFFFFDKAMIIGMQGQWQGILTGASNNLGDLPHHLGAITAFVEGSAFPPENPSFSGTKFSYPFLTDLVTAGSVLLGAGIKEAMHVQNLMWTFALLIIFEGFVFSLLKNRLAARLAPVILFFSGGLGFWWFFSDAMANAGGFSEYLFKMTKDYTIGEDFRWGNSLTTLFITQRGFLLGMPIVLLVLGVLWEIFISKDGRVTEEKDTELVTLYSGLSTKCLTAGLLTGMLPLIHLHSLAVLFIVTAFLFFMRLDKIKYWLTFGAAVLVIATPELIWSVSGSASRATEFIGWHIGWDNKDDNLLWFWLKNTGLLLPLIVLGIILMLNKDEDGAVEAEADEIAKKSKKKQEKQIKKDASEIDAAALLKFYIPFVFIFIVCNVVKLAPWQWDNIKVLIYWFLLSIPIVLFAVVKIHQTGTPGRLMAAALIFILTASGGLDVWRTVNGQILQGILSDDAVQIAQEIKNSTPRDSLFANAPTYNSAMVLTGRRSLMRYGGHLFSHGIDYGKREEHVKTIYRGGSTAQRLIEEYGVDYVLISPEEMTSMQANEQFFEQFPKIAEVGQYRVYRVNGK